MTGDIVTKSSIESSRRTHFPSYDGEDGVKYKRYDFSFIPDFGFLASNEPLAKNIELKLSFDREIGLLGVLDWSSQSGDVHDLLKKPLVLKDCHSVTEYISSDELRNHYDSIESSPLVYNYDESEVIIRSLDQNETSLRLEAIHGGNIPTYLFAGVIESVALNGHVKKTSTGFLQNNVKEFNININGHSVNGYPVKSEINCATFPFVKWLESTNRLHNNMIGETFSMYTFKKNFLWSHHFEVEETSNGWLSIDLKLSEAYTTNMSLVIWLISPCALSLDKFHQIEKIKM